MTQENAVPPSKPTAPHASTGQEQSSYNLGQKIGLVLGPVLFALMLLFFKPAGLSTEGARALAATVWIATWWVTEALPLSVTSLLPVILFPVLGLGTMKEVLAPYANPTIYLFLGGFIIALAIERWNLHRRIALTIIDKVGTSPSRLVLGFMLATGVISVFISNSATAMMMLPIGMAVISQIMELQGVKTDNGEVPRTNFGALVMLGIAYAASIGGVGSIIGSPPNAVFVGVLQDTVGIKMTFLDYMLVGIPFFLVYLFIAWWIMLKVIPPEFREIPGSRGVIRRELESMGPMTSQEVRVLVVFVLTALLWIIYPFGLDDLIPNIGDTMVAIFGALLLFLIPSGRQRGEFLLDESAFSKLPWGILLLFGAGFSVADVFQNTGVAAWLAESLTALQGVHYIVIILAVATLLVFTTEITSNSAIATIFVPVMASLATSLNVPPAGLMAVAAISCSMAFMMPVATPPNAIVFSTGYVTMKQMIKVGFFLNITAIILITLLGYFWIPLVWHF